MVTTLCHSSTRAVAISLLLLLFGCHHSQSPQGPLVPYVSMWTQARHRCVPQYPNGSVRSNHQGLGVAELTFTVYGQVARTALLEAPDVETAEAVKTCASQWVLGPTTPVETASRHGKLFFYFRIADGVGKVYAANDPAQKALLISLRNKDRDSSL